MSGLDAIRDEVHDGKVIMHLWEFYQWVLKNHPRIHAEFLKSKEGD